jgi:hypothetical protein
MSCDIVVLARNEPDVPTVVDGMLAFGEQVRARELDGGVTHLYDSEDRLLVSIEAPVLVNVPGEVERMLGSGPIGLPVWWVDVRAAADPPDAERVARRFADDLSRWKGGVVWTGEGSS